MNLVRENLGERYIQRHVVELPGWFSMVLTPNEQLKNQFIIGEIVPSIDVEKAIECLHNLEAFYSTQVDYTMFFDFFKTINFLISNSLTQDVFNLKIKPLYSLFKHLPMILFNEQTCRELAILSPFFPSAYDIDKVMENNMKKITKNIEMLQKIIE